MRRRICINVCNTGNWLHNPFLAVKKTILPKRNTGTYAIAKETGVCPQEVDDCLLRKQQAPCSSPTCTMEEQHPVLKPGLRRRSLRDSFQTGEANPAQLWTRMTHSFCGSCGSLIFFACVLFFCGRQTTCRMIPSSNEPHPWRRTARALSCRRPHWLL